MTRISTLPPVPYVLSKTTQPADNPSGKATAPDFPALLKAQFKPAASANPQAEAATNLSRRPDVEVMLQQMMACRKTMPVATSRSGRTLTGTLAVLEDDCADEVPDETTGIGEQSTDHAQAATVSRNRACGSVYIVGVPFECAINLSTTALAQPASLLTWVSTEAVQTPSPPQRARPLRQRKPLSVDGDQPEPGNSDFSLE
jgi:hypothetical protein